jgi:hypothetical protein
VVQAITTPVAVEFFWDTNHGFQFVFCFFWGRG